MAPPSASLAAVSVVWVSTYQFVVAYKDTKDSDGRPGTWSVTICRQDVMMCVFIVDSPIRPIPGAVVQVGGHDLRPAG